MIAAFLFTHFYTAQIPC